MSYYITGGTGFIGQNLVELLLKRRGKIYVLVRKGSLDKFNALKAGLGSDGEKVIPVIGDLIKPRFGLSVAKRSELEGKVTHFFHLAAIYDLKADAASQEETNNKGTQNAVKFAAAIKANRFLLYTMGKHFYIRP